MNEIDFGKLFTIKVHIYSDTTLMSMTEQILKLNIRQQYMLDNYPGRDRKQFHQQ